MADESTIPVTIFKERIAQARRSPCLVQIYPFGPTMGARHILGESPIILGREESCDVTIDDVSVSRRHASIYKVSSNYHLKDLKSTNGTFVNYQRTIEIRLVDGDYLSIGNHIFRFLGGENVENQYHEEIYRLSIFDHLTATPNKRYLLEFIDRELPRSLRHHRPLALIMFDVDHFKEVNDRLGHLAGDSTLRELAGCVKNVIRSEDLIARYGGEEFSLVLPETTHEGAVLLANRLRQIVAGHSFNFEDKHYQVTISLGVAATIGDLKLTSTDLIRQADEKLYQAKREGRNRVVG